MSPHRDVNRAADFLQSRFTSSLVFLNLARRLRAFALLSLMTTVGAGSATAAPIFTINPVPTVGGFTYVTSVSNFTTPYQTDGAGPATAIIGAPDSFGNPNPNTPGMVDYGGGNLADPWTVTAGFGSTFADGVGFDVRIFTTQLDPTEGWDLYASPDGSAMTFMGTFVPPASQVTPYISIDVDFNGTPLPAGATFLRFVGTQVPISSFTRGFDFDAVGVRYLATDAVPEPGTFGLVILGVVASRRVRRRLGLRA